MIPKMFVWVPVSAKQLRGYLTDIDEDEIQSAVLVPLEAGTAIAFAGPARLRDGLELAEVAKAKSGTTPVLFIWNDRAASVVPMAKLRMGWDWGTDGALYDLVVRPHRLGLFTELLTRVIDYFHPSRAGRARQARAARRIANALDAPADIVQAHVRDWENGQDVVVDLLDATAKTDLARVARQIDADAYAFWDGTRKLPIVTLDRD